MNGRSKAWFIIPLLLSILGRGFNYFDIHDTGKTRTPHIGGGSHRRTKYRPHVPNGKWLMKAHRSHR